MDDLISRQAAIEVIDAVFPVDPMKSEFAQGIACGAALAKTYVEQLPSEQPEPEELDFVQPHKKIGVRLEIGQPDRSLWFRIGEVCVDESKGFISPGRAVEKIRELLREAERREE